MTDRYLCGLWSKAVRILKGDVCVNCGAPAHSVHHILKRRYIVTRYDVKNGLPLCAVCHRIADRNSEFALSLLDAEDREYLKQMGMYTLKDWLMRTGQSRDEFLAGEADELKSIIRGVRE